MPDLYFICHGLVVSISYFDVSIFLRKIKAGEFAVVFSGGGIISASGVDFGFESADPYFFAIVHELAVPRGFFFIKIDAEKLGRAILFLSPVAGILGVSRKAEICSAIIETITIPMVNNKVGRRIHYFPVHIHGLCFIWFD
jgi:hypothetical protein